MPRQGAQSCLNQAATCSGDHAERLREASNTVGLLTLAINRDAAAFVILEVHSIAQGHLAQGRYHFRDCLGAALVQMGDSLIKQWRVVLQLPLASARSRGGSGGFWLPCSFDSAIAICW